ncbi:MAG: hypothetical protein PVI40_05475 [Chlamydiota bacterium]
MDLHNTKITGSCLTQLPSKNCLEKLNLRNCRNLIECFLASFFFYKAANLKEVDLNGTNITGEGLSFIAEKNKLEKIYLQECNNLKEGFLACFFLKAAHLKKVIRWRRRKMFKFEIVTYGTFLYSFCIF